MLEQSASVNSHPIISPSLLQLLAWPEHGSEQDDATVVTIAPEFHGARHHGYMSNLKKFQWYITAVLCFTTPGDGPASTPQLVQTHSDSELQKRTHTRTYLHFFLRFANLAEANKHTHTHAHTNINTQAHTLRHRHTQRLLILHHLLPPPEGFLLNKVTQFSTVFGQLPVVVHAHHVV